MPKNIMIFKFIIANLIAIVWLGASDYQTGWLRKLFFADTTYVNYMTASLFVIVWVNTAYWTLAANRSMNFYISLPDGKPDGFAGASMKFATEWIEKAAGWMLFLGLIGTIYGLMLSVSGINSTNFGNPEGIKQIVVQMVAGLRVELSTTLIGAMCGLWTEVNYYMLKHGVLALDHHEAR